MQSELNDLIELLEDIGRVCDNFDDPDRALVQRLRKQVALLSPEDRKSLRDTLRESPTGYLGWLEVGVANDQLDTIILRPTN